MVIRGAKGCYGWGTIGCCGCRGPPPLLSSHYAVVGAHLEALRPHRGPLPPGALSHILTFLLARGPPCDRPTGGAGAGRRAGGV